MPGKAHHAVGVGEGFDAGVDGGALGRVAEELGVLEAVLAELALDRIHDPGDVAHAADDLGVGEERGERGEFCRPGAGGVEYHLGGVGLVVGGEEAAEETLAGGAIDQRAHLGAGRDMRKYGFEQSGDGRGHAGRKARVLPQNSRQQRRAGPRKAGNKVEFTRHQHSPNGRVVNIQAAKTRALTHRSE